MFSLIFSAKYTQCKHLTFTQFTVPLSTALVQYMRHVSAGTGVDPPYREGEVGPLSSFTYDLAGGLQKNPNTHGSGLFNSLI